MSAKPNVCPVCGDKPKPLRRWHDKENRVFNHLKWQVECKRRCISSMGGYRAEAVALYNAGAAHKRDLLSAIPAVPKQRMTIKRLLQLIWNGERSAA